MGRKRCREDGPPCRIASRPWPERISLRHARGCRHRETRCTCSPTYQAQAWDAAAGKRITRTFPTLSAVRRWRQDAYEALRAGTLSADRGPTLEAAAEDWLGAARAGIVRTRSGDVYKPSAIRGYEQVLRLHVLPVLGHERPRVHAARVAAVRRPARL
jgi:hypothetical protein